MAFQEHKEESANKYDVVIFGATGFTGKFVVSEMARTADEQGVNWAVAGRNMQKLQKTLGEASKLSGKNLDEQPIIIADINSEQSIREMCKQTKVLINCVGPYDRYGQIVVKACIEEGTSHLDVAGEPMYLEKMELLYNKKAEEKKVYVIGACGFDSIPSDMGVVYTNDHFNGDLNAVEGYIQFKLGQMAPIGHFGTWESAIDSFKNNKAIKEQRKHLFTTKVPTPKHKLAMKGPLFFNDELKRWCVPFPGADRAVLRRTQYYYYKEKKERPIQFHAYVGFEKIYQALFFIMLGIILGVFSFFSIGRCLLKKFPRIFSLNMFTHEGPSLKQLETSTASYTFVGTGYETKLEDVNAQHEDQPNKKIITKISGPEMGYLGTAVFVCESAYTLLKEADKLPESGGVFTPGVAFAKTKLIARIGNRNYKFSVVEQ